MVRSIGAGNNAYHKQYVNNQKASCNIHFRCISKVNTILNIKLKLMQIIMLWFPQLNITSAVSQQNCCSRVQYLTQWYNRTSNSRYGHWLSFTTVYKNTLYIIMLRLCCISAPANPKSAIFRKSGQVQLWPNFQLDLPVASAAAVIQYIRIKHAADLSSGVFAILISVTRTKNTKFIAVLQILSKSGKHWS